MYGDPEVHPQDESYWGHVNPIGMRSCYDEGKRCAETLFFDYRRQHDMPVKVARIFNTYGRECGPTTAASCPTSSSPRSRASPLTIYGDGTQTRSFCFVDDLVDGLVRLMNTPHEVTGPINIGNPHEFTMSELAAKVIELVGREVPIEYHPLPADDPLSGSPTSRWRRPCSAGVRGSSSTRALPPRSSTSANS